MKKFIIHIAAFVVLSFISLQLVSCVIIRSDFFLYYEYPGNEVYKAIKQTKSTENAYKLILGDSVSRQFNPPGKRSDSVVSLACNQAISLCGQFILFNEYLKYNNAPKILELQLTPTSLRNDLDQVYTYHYFLKPFYTEKFRKYIDLETRTKIGKMPYYNISQFPFIKASKWAPNYGKDSIPDFYISNISQVYLKKIVELCNQNKTEFRFLPMPVTDSTQEKLLEMRHSEINDEAIEEILTKYFLGVKYYPDTLFRDGIHLRDISEVK